MRTEHFYKPTSLIFSFSAFFPKSRMTGFWLYWNSIHSNSRTSWSSAVCFSPASQKSALTDFLVRSEQTPDHEAGWRSLCDGGSKSREWWGHGGETVVGTTASELRGLLCHLVKLPCAGPCEGSRIRPSVSHPHPWATLDIFIDFFEL